MAGEDTGGGRRDGRMVEWRKGGKAERRNEEARPTRREEVRRTLREEANHRSVLPSFRRSVVPSPPEPSPLGQCANGPREGPVRHTGCGPALLGPGFLVHGPHRRNDRLVW